MAEVNLIYLPKIFGHHYSGFFIPHLGLATITSYLRKKGHKVNQYDLNARIYKIKEVSGKEYVNLEIFKDKERIKKYFKTNNDPELEKNAEKILDLMKKSIDIYAFSLETDREFSSMGILFVLSKIIKERYGSVIVAGGVDDIVLKKLIALKVIDYGISVYGSVSRNGHYPMERLCDSIDSKNDLNKIPNLVYNKEGKIITNRTEEKDNFVIPDYNGINLEDYKYFGPKNESGQYPKLKKGVAFLPYRFYYGCMYNCAFCANSQSEEYAIMKPDRITEELSYLSRKYKTKFFFFINTCINPTQNFVKELTKTLIENDLDLKFSDSAYVSNLDQKHLQLLKKSGALRLYYGFESGSEKILKSINKKITLEKTSEALKISDKLGIWNGLDIITGLPHEKEEDNLKTLSFIKKNNQYIDSYTVNGFRLIRNSLIARFPERYGIKNIRDFNKKSLLRFYDLTFDEKNGLEWKDKIMQTNLFRKRIINYLSRFSQYGQHEKTALLFYLYEIFDGKKEVKKNFEHIIKNNLD